MTNFESKLKEEIKEYFEGATFSNVSYLANAEGHFEAGAQWAFEELNAKILLLEKENEFMRKALQTINIGIDPRTGEWSEQFQDTLYKVFSAKTASDYAGETLSTLTKSKGDVNEKES